MSTSTLDLTELVFDFNSVPKCEDNTCAATDADATHVTKHGDFCTYLICDACMMADLMVIEEYNEVECGMCGEDWVPVWEIEFLPL